MKIIIFNNNQQQPPSKYVIDLYVVCDFYCVSNILFYFTCYFAILKKNY